jgi:uncharacterized protein (TIGR02996 family)
MTADPAELNALLAHCAATHDDAPRLVLADWLEEHGDFRAEFVRASLAFDRTPPYDVTRFQLAERLRAMLESRAFKKWLPASPAFKWGWRRGLLTLIADPRLLEAEDQTEVTDWLASDWIERVEFGYSSSRPRWEDTFGLVRNTREVDFDTDNYGPQVLTRLREWPHLRGLGISYLMGPWDGLAALPHLRALKLHPDWTMMPELHKARMPNLEVLDLNKEWEDDLPHWGTCFPKLRSLTLTQYNAYPDEQCERFAECIHLRHLALDQKYEPFSRIGFKALAKMKELRSLTLGPAPRGTVADLAKLPKLERLAAYGHAKRIQGLEKLTQLRWLSLGVETLTTSIAAQVIGLPYLTRLDLHLSAFEAGTLAALAKAPALRILRVTTRGERISLAELVRLEQLRYLWLRERDLSQSELLSLQTALPACRIVHGSLDMNEGDYDWS